jgi:molecular chaperone GrpE (heat shock protein)
MSHDCKKAQSQAQEAFWEVPVEAAVMGWFRKKPAAPTADASPQLLALQRQVQDLRLTLAERDAQVARLQADLERLRQGESARLADGLQAERERLCSEAGGPIAQLLTQAHLLEVEGKAVQARDVLAVARRLVRVLQDQGLELLGTVGEETAFDPNRHAPLGNDTTLSPGQKVRVRFVGVLLRGKVVRKAGVEVADARTTGR